MELAKISEISHKHPVIFYDGHCNLCNGFVQWIIKRDEKSVFRFTTLQSEEGAVIKDKLGLNTSEDETVIMMDKGRYLTESSVGIVAMKRLGGIYSFLYVFILIPPFIRNPIYRWIAKNRYRWFGKREECMIMTPELQSRFLV